MRTPEELQQFLLSPPRRIHLIGVAGSGMSGIAGLVLALGHEVSGSDRVSSLETRRLEAAGLKFYLPANSGDGSRSRTRDSFFRDPSRKSRL